MAQLVPYKGSLEGFIPEEELKTQAQPQGTQPKLVPYKGDLEGFVPEEELQLETSMEDQFRMQTEGWTPEQLAARKREVGQAVVDKQARFDAARQAQIDDIQNHPAVPLWVPKAAGKGVYKGAREMAVTGVAVADEVAKGIHGDQAPQYLPTVESALPDVQYDGLAETLVGETAGMAVGGGAGLKAGKLLTGGQAASRGGRVLQHTGKFASTETGMVAAQDADDKPMFLDQYKSDPKDPRRSEEIVNNKLNLLKESLAVGLGLGSTAKATSGSVGYVYDTIIRGSREWHKADAHQKAVVNDLMEVFAGVDPSMPPEVVQQRMQLAVNKVAANKELLVKFGDNQVPDEKIKRDVVSSMIESLDPSDSKSAIAKETLEGLRASSIKGGSSHLTTSLKNPGVVLDKKLDQLQSTRGGDPAIENSRVKLQDELEAPVVENRQLVGKAKDDVATAQRGIDAEISSNPGFKSITDRYGNPNQVDIDYSKTKENIRNEITQGVEEEAGRITTRKNQLYEDLPDGIEPNQQMIDSSLSEIPLPSNLVEKFDQVRGDYKKLRTFATNDLEKEIQNYRGAGKWGEADELRRLQRSLVDDQLDYVAKAARASDGKFRARHPEMAEKVETANTYMKETAGPLLRDNEPVSEIIDNRRYKGKDTATQRNRTIIESTINDRDRNIDIEKIGTLLGNDRKKLADYHKADVARIIKQRFIDRNGKLSPEDITALQGEFDKRIPGLTTGDPNSVKELNEFFTLIKDKNFNKESAMKILTDLETKGKEIEESVYDGALRDYFAKVGGQQVRNERGFDIAKRVIDSEPRSLDAALKSGDETVRKGYEVSWAKAVKERMKESDIPKLLTENFKEAGNKIFKNPLISEAIDSIAFEAQKGLGANKTRMTQGIDHGAPQERARLAVNNLITWTFGVLNPTAAKIRTVSGDYLKKNDSWDMAKQAADVVLADTDLFIKIAQEMIDKKAKQLTPEQKQLMFRVITKAGYNVKKQDRESKIKEQTEQIQK